MRLAVLAKAFRDGYAPSKTASASLGLVIYENAVVTTLAGSGVAGVKDNTGTNAQFDFPSALRLDSHGNLFVGELVGSVRKIFPSGEVTTVIAPVSTNFFGERSIHDLCLNPEGGLFLAAGDYRIWANAKRETPQRHRRAAGESSPRKGHIGFQELSRGAEHAMIRNVRIKVLD